MLPAPTADLALSLVNTRYWRPQPTPTETLNEPADLLAWARAIPDLADQAEACAAAWRAAPEAAAAGLASALAWREAMAETLGAAARGVALPDASLAALNAALASVPGRTALVCDGPAPPRIGWRGEAAAPLTALLAPSLWSAADLLSGPARARLRVCDNPECGWLFLDDSRAGRRRWCMMSACGNRAKARRHYLKKKGGA